MLITAIILGGLLVYQMTCEAKDNLRERKIRKKGLVNNILDPNNPADRIVLCEELCSEIENTLFTSDISAHYMIEITATARELRNLCKSEIKRTKKTV